MTSIFNYFNTDETIFKRTDGKTEIWRKSSKKGLLGDFDAMFNKLHGKELSYNNLLDVEP
jgi:phosphoribosylaminoimidazolecarboxamide formyltransferase/IMP cyclohydrolase